MVETLIVKTTAWEEERGKPFMYDGVRNISYIFKKQPKEL
jgi:hypothetical protein